MLWPSQIVVWSRSRNRDHLMGMTHLSWNIWRIQRLRMMLSQAPLGLGELDGELPAFMKAKEDQLQTCSDDERQHNEEQLPLPPNPRAQKEAQRRWFVEPLWIRFPAFYSIRLLEKQFFFKKNVWYPLIAIHVKKVFLQDCQKKREINRQITNKGP